MSPRPLVLVVVLVSDPAPRFSLVLQPLLFMLSPQSLVLSPEISPQPLASERIVAYK